MTAPVTSLIDIDPPTNEEAETVFHKASSDTKSGISLADIPIARDAIGKAAFHPKVEMKPTVTASESKETTEENSLSDLPVKAVTPALSLGDRSKAFGYGTVSLEFDKEKN